MTASALITVLSRNISLYGDKPVLVKYGKDEPYKELMLGRHKDFYGADGRNNSKKLKCILLDMDLI